MDDVGRGHKRKKSSPKSSLIDHTYYDYSTRELSSILPDSRRNDEPQGRVTFPMKLHSIISNPRYRHIICWMPHGRSWKILDKELLASVVCKENFNHENFDSINRSINGWGFKRLRRAGPDNKSYYHEMFLRGRPELTQAMTRLINPGKRIPDPNGEPDFYDIAKRFPLPEDPHTFANEPNDVIHNKPSPLEHHPVAYSTSSLTYEQEPPRQTTPLQLDYREAKRQRHERHSFPPDGSSDTIGYAHHAYENQAGYGPYPTFPQPLLPYPYGEHRQNNHPPGQYMDTYRHQHALKPHISPERHYLDQGYYQHPWHPQQNHYPFASHNLAERGGSGQYANILIRSQHGEAVNEAYRPQLDHGISDKSNDTQERAKSTTCHGTYVSPPVIHQQMEDFGRESSMNTTVSYQTYRNPKTMEHQEEFPS